MSGIDEYSQLKIFGANFRFRRLMKGQQDILRKFATESGDQEALEILGF